MADAASAITLLVRPPHLWWDDRRQRRDVKDAILGQKLLEKSFVHVHWGDKFSRDRVFQKEARPCAL